MKSFLLSNIFGAGLFCASCAWAQAQPALDRVRMQRDLDIMEMVLERLLNENAAPMMRLGGQAARGVYLPEFGVLFQVPQTLSSFSYFEFHAGDLEGAATEEGAQSASSYGRGRSSSRHLAVSAEAFESELMDFFTRYADAIGQLRPGDRIAVYRSAGPEVSVFFNFSGAAGRRIESSSQPLLAWVGKADLDALQTGQLGAEDFKRRVNFVREHNTSAGAQSERNEIEVLAGAVEVTLGLPGGTVEWVYIDGYGAVLFTRTDFMSFLPRRAWEWRSESQNISSGEPRPAAVKTIEEYLRAVESAGREREKSWQGEYEQFKEKVFTVLADYGHTLRQLAAEERVVVVADFPNAPERLPRQLVCAVKKRPLENYHRHALSRAQLRQAMAFYEN